MDAPLMIVLVGPNGAGKTTYYFNELELAHPSLAFINADFIQYREMKNHDMAAAYVAANMAAERRDHCLQQRQSFIWESTFSHPSKLETIHLARDAGYCVELIHIGVASAEICIERVAQRVKEGGHDVPEEKIIARFERNRSLIKAAVVAATRAQVFDNSTNYEEPLLCLRVEAGKSTTQTDTLPAWVAETYIASEPYGA